MLHFRIERRKSKTRFGFAERRNSNMIRTFLSSARGKALLGLVLLLCLLAGALLFWQTDAGDSAHYTLVGDGYIV